MELARIFSGKKFMWDGSTYESREQAEEVLKKYKNDGFEVELFEEDGQWFLFTRRLVREVKVEGQPT